MSFKPLALVAAFATVALGWALIPDGVTTSWTEEVLLSDGHTVKAHRTAKKVRAGFSEPNSSRAVGFSLELPQLQTWTGPGHEMPIGLDRIGGRWTLVTMLRKAEGCDALPDSALAAKVYELRTEKWEPVDTSMEMLEGLPGNLLVNIWGDKHVVAATGSVSAAEKLTRDWVFKRPGDSVSAQLGALNHTCKSLRK